MIVVLLIVWFLAYQEWEENKDGTDSGNSLARAILNKRPRSADDRVIHVDGPNEGYMEDWNELIINYPNCKEKYVVYHKKEKKLQDLELSILCITTKFYKSGKYLND